MRAVLVLMLAVLALAGCAHPSAEPGPGASDTYDPATAPTASAPLACACVATVHHLDLSWSGQIPYGAWACETKAAGTCQAVPPGGGAYGVLHDADGPGQPASVQGGNLTLTWTSASPLTERMAIGLVGIMPGEPGNETHFGGPDVVGTSPLVFPIQGGQVLPAGMVLRIWVYSGDYHVAAGEAAGTSGQQDFQVAGAVDLAY